MSPLHHRKPGLVGAALTLPVTCELIADGIHIHPAALALAIQAKGLDRVELITDSMRACLLGEGKSELGGQTVYVKDGRATLEDGTLAGSILTMDRAVRNIRSWAHLTLPQPSSWPPSTRPGSWASPTGAPGTGQTGGYHRVR